MQWKKGWKNQERETKLKGVAYVHVSKVGGEGFSSGISRLSRRSCRYGNDENTTSDSFPKNNDDLIFYFF